MRARSMFGSAILVTLMACGGDGGGGGGGMQMSTGISPKEACEDTMASLCERFYTCYTEVELASIGFPSAEAACVTMFQANEGCSQQTAANLCKGNETYHADQADKCVDQVAGLTCGQLRDVGLDFEAAAPACNKVCAID